MKKFITIILLLTVIFSFSQKNTLCIYKVKKNMVLKTNNENEKMVNQLMNKALDVVDKLEYQLIFNKNESSFYLKKSLSSKTDREFQYRKIAELVTSTGKYYQNLSDFISIHQFTVYGEDFLVNQPLNNNWTITNIKKDIGKYTCYKAINNCNSCNNSNITEVWYTPQIAIPFGPRGYGGLPGLIVEVKMKTVTIYLNEVINNNSTFIERPTKGKSVTIDEYKEITSKLRPTG